MEAIQESVQRDCAVDSIKLGDVCDEADGSVVAPMEPNVCHRSNGVGELHEIQLETPKVLEPEPVSVLENNIVENNVLNIAEGEAEGTVIDVTPVPEPTPATEATESIGDGTNELDGIGSSKVVEGTKELINTSTEQSGHDIPESVVEVDCIMDSSNENVTFKTEVVIESSVYINETEIVQSDPNLTNDILGEIGHNIELSEVLGSSNDTQNVENNNCDPDQQVFNKEQLLDILEGNDAPSQISDSTEPDIKLDESQMALEQISRLKTKIKGKLTVKDGKNTKHPKGTHRKSKNEKEVKHDKLVKNDKILKRNVTQEENIVNVLVKDWDDDEPMEEEENNKVDQSSNLVEASETQHKEDDIEKPSPDKSATEGQTPSNKSTSEDQPLKRLGRVIKKKVIFDPDNPDTFCMKVKDNSGKNAFKEIPSDKDIKKIKTEVINQVQKSKTLLQSKLQWKKPSPKTSKQCKRLTEIDKLLMDEGAVNMICQLTPEAPKGKKNMKSKAEFIKKIQSSTPISKEMKFRERKKESKLEDSEAKKIIGGKRLSLSNSVKSPSVCEDFENTSADDSIIYRRHSSSSYSSSCMSPRRLSDVEGAVAANTRAHQGLVGQNQKLLEDSSYSMASQAQDVFMAVDTSNHGNDTINKTDYLSMKEKLNSKLSLALNKRKRDSGKADKPSKVKKLSKAQERPNKSDYKYLTVKVEERLAEICICKSGSVYNADVINELEKALNGLQSTNETSVTLITSECGSLCSGLDLKSILESDAEQRTKCAYEMAESVRRLLVAVSGHSKLLVSAVSGRCAGAGVALAALSDVALAGEGATFQLAAGAALEPGAAALAARPNPLSQSLVHELVVSGRAVAASEALAGGLLARLLWRGRPLPHARDVARDLAAQPAQNIILKKKLLSLKKAEAEVAFQNSLEKERDIFVEYWTSPEGLELISSSLSRE